jgi:hypothetical protein
MRALWSPALDSPKGADVRHRLGMRSRLVVFVIGLVTVLALASVAAAANGGRSFSTALTGAAEVPGPGDADASGQAVITLNQGKGQVCYDLTWSGIDGTVIAAHIHAAPAGIAGPVVVPLAPGSGCTTIAVSEELIKAIRRDPSNYYVNIHSTAFPAGAIRGQLAK